jgi:signal peptidase I
VTSTDTISACPPQAPGARSPRPTPGPGKRSHRWRTVAVTALAVALAGGAVYVRGAGSPTIQSASPPGSAGGYHLFTLTDRDASMEPTVNPGDRILAVTRFTSVRRGDVIIFDPPSRYWPPSTGPTVKRIIGLPGDTISSVGGSVLLDGRLLSEPYLVSNQETGAPIVSQVVPAGHYFVMGDNLGASNDSRDYGPISASSIMGVVTTIVAPVSQAGPIPGPSGSSGT